MSGLTSPARQWFNLTAPDYDLNENPDVDAWLYIVTDRMSQLFAKSNLYNALPMLYSDMGAFGTGALFISEDEEDIIRFQTFPIGSYYIGNGPGGRVNVFGREFPLTVRQLVHEYGKRWDGKIDWSNISDTTKGQYQSGRSESKVDIRHVIMPNEDYDPESPLTSKKKFISLTYEISSGSESKFLRKRGYDLFPGLFPRWEISGEDVYGTDCPGMVALGDIKQLQHGELKLLNAIDKIVDPPMVASPSMRQRGVFIRSGDTNYDTDTSGRGGIRPAHEVNLRIGELAAKQVEVQDRIRRAFYEDLFLMLASRRGQQPLTATEVNERAEEKLLALGPVLEQLNQDLLDPLIEISFEIMSNRGMVPKPPEELQGRELKVEYLSVMAQSQKMVGLGTMERFFQMYQAILPIDPRLADKVDTDQAVDVYADLISLPPRIVRSDEQVEAIRQQRAQQEQQMQQMQMIEQGSKAAKNLAQSDMEGNNALSAMVGGGGAE
jgi:Bacteriophage head to tail connecting protein